ncbi:hypothetical protein [Pseudanabaena sp. PCC 6802]|uniref:hypothetical protein n=1 Tax=Pseudanabaena sp. PCC 6802 TaxID=118173 RepID=UPI000348EBBE|nr:hypothetical protein [Pseudanabaena sp. PCC 6802]
MRYRVKQILIGILLGLAIALLVVWFGLGYMLRSGIEQIASAESRCTYSAATIQVPSVGLKDLGTDNVQGILFSKFLRRVVAEVFTAVVDRAKSALPR